MTSEEKKVLKERYKELKGYYNVLKTEIKKTPLGSDERYKINMEMMYLKEELEKVRMTLYSFLAPDYFHNILGEFVSEFLLGEKSPRR